MRIIPPETEASARKTRLGFSFGIYLTHPLTSFGPISERSPSGVRSLATLADMSERRGFSLNAGLFGSGEEEVEARVPNSLCGHP